MNLHTEELSTNTPDRRWACVTVPGQFRHCSFLTFPSGQEGTVRALQAWLVIGLPPIMVLWGPTGTGKTGLACAALRSGAHVGLGSRERWNIATAPVVAPEEELEWSPTPVWFESWRALRDRVRRSGFLREEDALSLLRDRVVLLTVDDVDVDRLTPWKESLLLSLLEEARPVQGLLLLTMNAAPDRWPAQFGERLADRLLGSSVQRLHISGPSLRG